MIKYFVRIGEAMFDRWGSDYIAFSTKSEHELKNDERFLEAVDEAIHDLYFEYGEEDEEEEEFVDSGGINEIRPFNEETDNPNLDILYDENMCNE